MILVVAAVRLHPGHAPEFEAAVADFMSRVRAANPGVLFYHAGRCRDDMDSYSVIEAYADEAAMERHIASSELHASLADLTPLIADIQITISDAVT